jgi:sirohydrochlorin ferrochelatase
VAERRDIPDALRDAVERTVQATVETRGKAQGAVDDIAGSVDELVKGAEKNLTQRRRSVRAAVGKGLPATQEDVKELRTELRRIARRLEAIEERLPPAKPSRAKTKKPRSAGS